jgi:hypothetical protein
MMIFFLLPLLRLLKDVENNPFSPEIKGDFPGTYFYVSISEVSGRR